LSFAPAIERPTHATTAHPFTLVSIHTETTSQKRTLISGGKGSLASALKTEFITRNHKVFAPSKTEMDVSDSQSVNSYLTQSGPVDCLIHTAGNLIDKPFMRISESDWDQVLNTHLHGAARLCRATLPSMLTRGQGHIILIASFAIYSAPIGQTAYTTAKSALIAFTQSLASETGCQGIQVNAVLPGFLPSKMTANLPPHTTHRIQQAHTLNTPPTLTDCARFIAELTTFPSISGQIFQLDSRLHKWT